MRQNGLLMEVKGKKAVVLGKDGRFYKTTAQSGWQTGQEITWDPNLKRKAYRVPIWQRTLAAGAAACLILGGGLWYAVQHSTITRAYAYVSVDINPSILYTLNHREKVIAARGLNADGRTLLTHFHPKGEGLQKVLSQTIQTAVLNQMLPNKDTILVTAAPIQANEDISTLMSMARADMEQAVSMNPQAAKQHPGVYSLPVSAAVSQAAQKLNMSPGKLIAYLAAHEAGQNVGMQQLHGEVLKEILTNAQLPNVLSTIQGDNVHQIEDWVSNAMSVAEHPAVQKQSNPNSSNNSGENVVTPAKPNLPQSPQGKSKAPSSHMTSPSTKGQSKLATQVNQKGSSGGSQQSAAKGKSGGKGGNSSGQGNVFSLGKKPSLSAAEKAAKNAQNQDLQVLKNIINEFNSMRNIPKRPNSSDSKANALTSSKMDSQNRLPEPSSAGNNSSTSPDSQSDNGAQSNTQSRQGDN
ncbi:anti-sigma factor domain-containing protein [Alicyclobacillus sp. SO9]|uniref:anti-sigma factor domain-containing protein n=1 Tax=Alicyclobacillus sp. SO9 TaxID=2665646 RepID=UPI0018E90405|nr:anti-sigma factor domain-containing protein [Alicyclobacillus sp. SO9]QQE77461.1 anti-sigma factor domain-containing protein [Alicyclobacillus sp. SO9]